MATTLRVSGREPTKAETPPLVGSQFHQVTREQTILVEADRSGAKRVEIVDVQPTDLVEAHLADGAVVVTTYARLRELVADPPRQRGGEPGSLGPLLELRGAQRGAGKVSLRLLRLLRVEPVSEIADLATRQAIAVVEKRLAAPPGLYRLAADGTFAGEAVSAPLPAQPGPLLILLHGTASSTMGSFQGLFGKRRDGRLTASDEWKTLSERYADRTFALEHHTLSASPAQNALDLVRLLPAGAELHLVSHSRGGLVGELLCRGGFQDGDLAAFKHEERVKAVPDELATLLALGEELGRKQLRIERFVRVACPAAGTVLASDRLDLYLSVLLSLLHLAAPPIGDPVLLLLQAAVLEIARRRARPEELPGLEAQRPASPYTHFLNKPQANVAQDLAVIAGDLRHGTVLQSLRALVGYGFFWQKNDLVVHTRAMYAGLPRDHSWVSFHEGAAVTHFSYFSESGSRSRLLAALGRPGRDSRPHGFEDLRKALDKQSFSALRGSPQMQRSTTAVRRTVLFLPDLLGTRLSAGGEEVWPSAAAIAVGGLGALADPDDDAVAPQAVVDSVSIAALEAAIGNDRRVEGVPYDWRRGSRAAAAALKTRLEASPKPVGVVAHGLGALGVLSLLAELGGDDLLRDVAILLAAPPLHGSEAALRLCLGEGRLFDMLKCLDQAATASDISSFFQRLPGVVELLPDRVLDPQWWSAAARNAPESELLAEVAARRAQLVALAVAAGNLPILLGASEVTFAAGLADHRLAAGEDGDGWMRNPVDLSLESRTWFAPALHERLLAHPVGAAAAVDLLRNGTTGRAARQPPAERPNRQPPPFVFPSQGDLESELLAGDAADAPPQESILRARVAHGGLDRLEGRPLLVGHYAGDSVFGAEAFLDICLEGRLRDRHRLGTYPGLAGTAAYVPAPGCTPDGALVVGLGDAADLTAAVLSVGTERAVLARALASIEARADRREETLTAEGLPIASLLVGTRGGVLSVRQSMVAILRGVLSARRALAGAGLDRLVTIDEVTFVELWSDIAISAGHALRELAEDAGLGRAPGEHVLPAATLLEIEGGRGNSSIFGGDWSWWRRIIVTEEKEQREGGRRRDGLRFVTLGERSRAEDSTVFTQRAMVDELIERAPTLSATADDGSLVNALYELLLPPRLKETIFEGRDLVLVVDRGSGRYPWELLARRSSGSIEPLISRIRVVRQFKTQEFREIVTPARTNHALVIGEPDLGAAGFLPLPKAREEAEAVIAELEKRQYTVEASLGDSGGQIGQKLFRHHYRLLHVAAHGEFDAGNPGQSGVIIGRNADGSLTTLSGDLFRQLPAVPELVFLNCCYLGSLDEPGATAGGLRSDADRTQLAASVAEALMGLGVRCLVVAGWAVDDAAAKVFAQEFYRRILRGESFGIAVHEARCAVWAKHRDTTTWGAYQCYGDPSFRLRPPQGGNAGKREFVSARELTDALADVAASASATGASDEYRQVLQQRLRDIETFLAAHPAWRSGELLHEMAEAWKATGDRQRAVALYRAALRATDAGAPLKAAEQLCNLLDRLEQAGTRPERVRAGDLALFESDKTLAKVPHALRWLDWADRVSGTVERANLRGGIFKRAAAKKRAGGHARTRLLAEATTAYRRAVELGVKAGQGVNYYPGLNVAALIWAAKGAGAAAVREFVVPSRRSARAERNEGRNLWNVIAECEADLIEALLLGQLNDRAVQGLKQRYKRIVGSRLGTPTERASASSQIEFLRAFADAATKKRLDLVLSAFAKE